MKIDKDALVKNQFWIGLGAFVLLWLIGAIVVLASGDDAEKTKYEAAKKAIKGVTNVKSAEWQKPWNAHGERFRKHKDTVWHEAWDLQSEPRVAAYRALPPDKGAAGEGAPAKARVWINPSELSQADRQWVVSGDNMNVLPPMYTWESTKVAPLQSSLEFPEDKFGVDWRDEYRAKLYRKQFDKVSSPVWPDGGPVFARQFVDVPSPVVFPGGPLAIMPPQSWAAAGADKSPTAEEAWLAQEDFWVRREMLYAVREALESASRFKEVSHAFPSNEEEARALGLPAAARARYVLRNPTWELDLVIEQGARQWVISGKSKIKNVHASKRPQRLTSPHTGRGVMLRLTQLGPARLRFFELSERALGLLRQNKLVPEPVLTKLAALRDNPGLPRQYHKGEDLAVVLKTSLSDKEAPFIPTILTAAHREDVVEVPSHFYFPMEITGVADPKEPEKLIGEPLRYGEPRELGQAWGVRYLSFFGADPRDGKKLVPLPFVAHQVFEKHNSPIREVSALALGQHSHRTVVGALKVRPDLKALDPAAQAEAKDAKGKDGKVTPPGGGQVGMPPGAPKGMPPGGQVGMPPGGPGQPGVPGPGGKDAAATEHTSVFNLPRNRYLHVTPQSWHLPIALRMVVEQAHVHDVLGALMNSRLRVQITQVQVYRAAGYKTPEVPRKKGKGGKEMAPGKSPGPPPGLVGMPPGLVGMPPGVPFGKGSMAKGMFPPGVDPKGMFPMTGDLKPPPVAPNPLMGFDPTGKGAPPAPPQDSSATLVELTVYGVAALYARPPYYELTDDALGYLGEKKAVPEPVLAKLVGADDSAKALRSRKFHKRDLFLAYLELVLGKEDTNKHKVAILKAAVRPRPPEAAPAAAPGKKK